MPSPAPPRGGLDTSFSSAFRRHHLLSPDSTSSVQRYLSNNGIERTSNVEDDSLSGASYLIPDSMDPTTTTTTSRSSSISISDLSLSSEEDEYESTQEARAEPREREARSASRGHPARQLPPSPSPPFPMRSLPTFTPTVTQRVHTTTSNSSPQGTPVQGEVLVNLARHMSDGAYYFSDGRSVRARINEQLYGTARRSDRYNASPEDLLASDSDEGPLLDPDDVGEKLLYCALATQQQEERVRHMNDSHNRRGRNDGGRGNRRGNRSPRQPADPLTPLPVNLSLLQGEGGAPDPSAPTIYRLSDHDVAAPLGMVPRRRVNRQSSSNHNNGNSTRSTARSLVSREEEERQASRSMNKQLAAKKREGSGGRQRSKGTSRRRGQSRGGGGRTQRHASHEEEDMSRSSSRSSTLLSPSDSALLYGRAHYIPRESNDSVSGPRTVADNGCFCSFRNSTCGDDHSLLPSLGSPDKLQISRPTVPSASTKAALHILQKVESNDSSDSTSSLSPTLGCSNSNHSSKRSISHLNLRHASIVHSPASDVSDAVIDFHEFF